MSQKKSENQAGSPPKPNDFDQLSAVLPYDRIDYPYELCRAAFLRSVIERSIPYIHKEQFPVDKLEPKTFDGLGDVQLIVGCEQHGVDDVLLELPDGLICHCDHSGKRLTAHIAGEDRDAVQAAMKKLRQDLESQDGTTEQDVGVYFWSAGPDQNGTWSHRMIHVPTFQETEQNYRTNTLEQLKQLADVEIHDQIGRLILWRGEPGTGKTHALRSLLHAWRDRVSPYYITDPERFFGAGTSYMMNTLTATPGHDEDHWRLLIFEDAGEIIGVDARQETGQALSRLLNATDGLLGQGTKTLILITTNEPIAKLHPAVRRPGRCLAKIEFDPLSAKEANAWLEARGSDKHVETATTLATLYALASGRSDLESSGQHLGF